LFLANINIVLIIAKINANKRIFQRINFGNTKYAYTNPIKKLIIPSFIKKFLSRIIPYHIEFPKKPIDQQ